MSHGTNFKPASQTRAMSLNPFASADAEWIEEYLRNVCAEGLRASDRRELEDQIEALVPALVELRDAGHIALDAKTLASFGTLAGFIQLAGDERLSTLSQQRCNAICVRLIVQGIKPLLGRD